MNSSLVPLAGLLADHATATLLLQDDGMDPIVHTRGIKHPPVESLFQSAFRRTFRWVILQEAQIGP